MVDTKRLREVLTYNKRTGIFQWKTCLSNVVRGKIIAGGINHQGYRVIRIDNRKYQASRLAFLWVIGRWPKEMDHINGVRDDNRWSNLREVSRRMNMQNCRSAHSNNKAGVLGVSKRKDRYVARINAGGRKVALGTYDTAEEASNAYISAKRIYHAGCTL